MSNRLRLMGGSVGRGSPLDVLEALSLRAAGWNAG